MTSKDIRKYLTKDFSQEEKQSYLNYINGDQRDDLWVEKGLEKRDVLINHTILCDKNGRESICGKYVNIYENGECKCPSGHDCCDIVSNIIHKLNKISD